MTDDQQTESRAQSKEYEAHLHLLSDQDLPSTNRVRPQTLSWLPHMKPCEIFDSLGFSSDPNRSVIPPLPPSVQMICLKGYLRIATAFRYLLPSLAPELGLHSAPLSSGHSWARGQTFITRLSCGAHRFGVRIPGSWLVVWQTQRALIPATDIYRAGCCV
jgi:hypothetical protein